MDLRHLAETAFQFPLLEPRPYSQKAAVVLATDCHGVWCQITEYPDIYVALNTITDTTSAVDCGLPGQPLLDAVALAILTTGWASPIDETVEVVPPSQHPGRRRVRIALVVTADLAIGSILGFEDDPDNPMFDEGHATGELPAAALDAMRAVIAYQQASKATRP